MNPLQSFTWALCSRARYSFLLARQTNGLSLVGPNCIRYNMSVCIDLGVVSTVLVAELLGLAPNSSIYANVAAPVMVTAITPLEGTPPRGYSGLAKSFPGLST